MAKVIFTLKGSVKLRHYLLSSCVAACHGMACVLYAQHAPCIRELALNLAKVIFTLKHSVKLRHYLLCGGVAACHGMACVLCAQHTTHMPFHDMLPHNWIINNDVISPNLLT